MKLFMRAKAEEAFKGSSVARIQRMETPQLVLWFNNILVGLGQSFDQWNYKDGPSADVTTALNSLDEIWKELCSRNNG
jgi:hypothetical protein